MKLTYSTLAIASTIAIGAIYSSPARAISPNDREEAHPYMSDYAANSMHNDSYNSDAHDFAGPTSQKTVLRRFQYSKLFGLCPAFAFDTHDRIVTLCVKALKTKLYVLDSKNLSVLGSMELPRRKGVVLAVLTLQFQKALKDTSGGAYFYLERDGRIVIPTSDRRVFFVRPDSISGSNKVRLSLENEFDLKPYIPATHCATIMDPDFDDPRCDKLTSVLQDWQGRFWFVSRYGVVGVMDPLTDQVHTIKIPEQIQNSFSMAKDGAYIVSDTAMYRFVAGRDGVPRVEWRKEYDRGKKVKVGQINQGSGTTPTLFGGRYVAIGDNANPKMNVVVYDRLEGGRQVCKVPVFSDDTSACENSFVGIGNSLVISNSYGYKNPFQTNHPARGMVRIDVDAEGKNCHQVWKNDTVLPVSATPKLSLGSGLIYFYSRDRKSALRRWQWYVGGVDFETGKLSYRRNTGKGLLFDNFWGTISPGPNRSVAVGALQGLMTLTDQ